MSKTCEFHSGGNIGMAKDNTKFTGKNRLDIEARRYSWLVYDYFDFYRKNGWGKVFGRY